MAALVFEPLAEAGINVDMIVQNVGHHGATDLSFTIQQVELARRSGCSSRSSATSVPRGHDRHRGREVSIVGAGIQNALGYADVPDAGRCRGQASR